MDNQKKITIIILGVFSILLIIIFIFLNFQKKDSSLDSKKAIVTEINALPTGILVQKEQIKNNELDIVSVQPDDGSFNISLDSTIEVVFSRKFTRDEIKFSIDPDPIFTTSLTENKLIIEPLEPLQEGTLYTYSVNFPDDPNKIRLYRFTTKGQLSEFLPNTYDKELFEESEQFERQKHPDIYIFNRTPFENDFFEIDGSFQVESPQHYYFRVIPKSTDQDSVTQSLTVWLELQGLTAEQIKSLDIRYQ